jgi:hypothetical protein
MEDKFAIQVGKMLELTHHLATEYIKQKCLLKFVNALGWVISSEDSGADKSPTPPRKKELLPQLVVG